MGDRAPDRVEVLRQLTLLRGQPPDEPLRTLCHHDFLVGGLSIALDVKLDEALGPLLEVMGGPAPRIRVLDVRGASVHPESSRGAQLFTVKIGKIEHHWEADGLESLVDTLNRAFAAEPGVKALVLLGEWEDMIQVWAVPKPALLELLKHDWFKPSNPPGLRAALGRGRSSST